MQHFLKWLYVYLSISSSIICPGHFCNLLIAFIYIIIRINKILAFQAADSKPTIPRYRHYITIFSTTSTGFINRYIISSRKPRLSSDRPFRDCITSLCNIDI